MSYIEWIRSKVGTRKIFLAFASVVLWDENGRLLLQHRTKQGFIRPYETILKMVCCLLTAARLQFANGVLLETLPTATYPF